MGKVWFSVTVSPWDPANEPTAKSVAAAIAGYAVATPLILATGGGAMWAAAAVGGLMASTASGGTTTATGGGTLAFSVVGASRDGVYSDGSTLAVRGKLNDVAAYALYYAADEELRARPYTGPPSDTEIEALARARMYPKPNPGPEPLAISPSFLTRHQPRPYPASTAARTP